MARNLVALGWTEEVTTCDCCGKGNLAGTMAMECQDTGEVLYYGSTCATRHAGRKGLVKEANRRREELQREFNTRSRKLPEARAYNAKIEEGLRLDIEPGKEWRLFLGDLPEIMRAAEQRLRVEMGLDDAWKRRAA
jgi:hypothetical protein